MFLKTNQIDCIIYFYDLEIFGVFILNNALVEVHEVKNYERFFFENLGE